MYSMHAIGKFISNFRDFYNEINAATLTGAIDVVVVEQPDGSYTCSPFHVRFGKLGVLRSREKIVDIEINGEPQDIHMKLGESGEAFFVEEVSVGNGSDDYVPPHLACSPIPQDYFPPHFTERECENKLRESEVGDEEGQDDEASEEHPFVMEDIDGPPNNFQEQDFSTFNNLESPEALSQTKEESSKIQPKTFRAETLTESTETADKVRKISLVQGEFRPISVDNGAADSEQGQKTELVLIDDAQTDISMLGRKDSYKENAAPVEETVKLTNSNNRRKKRRKSLKKKAGQKRNNGGSSSQTEQSELSEGRETRDQEEGSEVTFQDEMVEPPVTCSHLGGLIVANDGTTLYSSNCETCNNSSMKATITVNTSEPQTNVVSQASDNLLFAAASNLAELSRIQHASTETDFHFFSDTELTPGCSPQDSRPGSPVQSDTEYEMNRQSKAVGTEEESNQDHGVMQQSWRWGELPSPPPRSLTTKEKSDPEPISSSDEDVQKQQQAAEAAQRSMLSGMFSFMKKTKRLRHNPESEGIYLCDLNTDELDPEVAALYFPTSYKQAHGVQDPAQQSKEQLEHSREEEDAESGNGTSLPQSPNSVEGAVCGPKSLDSDFEEPKHSIFEKKSYGEISLSLCGGLSENESGPTEDTFLQNLVTYDDLVRDPKIIENPNLVIRLNGKYYNWRTVSPVIISLVVFQKPLPQEVVDTLYSEYMPLKKGQKKDSKDSKQYSYSSWFSWRRASEPKKIASPAQKEESAIQEADKLVEVNDVSIPSESLIVESQEKPAEKPTLTLHNLRAESSKPVDVQITPYQNDKSDPADIENLETPTKEQYTDSAILTPAQKESKEEGYSGSNSSDESDGGRVKSQCVKKPLEKRSYYDHPEKYRKTLRLSSDQIASLNLNEGANEVVFSVTTAYQGTTRCKCHIYRWRYDDKIVISDIDGTITKSDVLGHILPIVGKDWAQSGVAQLFTKIKNNGYKLLYLSARAIGQARVTREYLKSIKQGDLSLPEGPLLLNPTSLISAFHREVIEKKPEEFKISCLRDIQALFPEDSKPFYAGYGNRINDVWAYRAVGIPIFRIFTINHRGELKHELTQTFQSSYSNMSYIVDQMFPPPPEDTSEDFSHFIYWRDPIAEVELDPLVVSEHAGGSTMSESAQKKIASTA